MTEERNPESQGVEARIRAHYDSMSAGQQKVAEFVLARRTEAAYLPAARIAELVGVSHSTVIRTAQALGFEGFPDFQMVQQGWLLERISMVESFQFASAHIEKELASMQDGDEASVFRYVMQASAAHIERVAQQIPAADFERTVDMLDSARRVYVIGLRYSASLALSFGLALRNLRPDCYILQPGIGDLPEQLEGISKDDLLFAISCGSYPRDTLRCMEYARRIGAPVVTITDSPLSPPAKRADLVFAVPVRLWSMVMSAAPPSLIGALTTALALRRKDDRQVRMEYLDEMCRYFQSFESE